MKFKNIEDYKKHSGDLSPPRLQSIEKDIDQEQSSDRLLEIGISHRKSNKRVIKKNKYIANKINWFGVLYLIGFLIFIIGPFIWVISLALL